MLTRVELEERTQAAARIERAGVTGCHVLAVQRVAADAHARIAIAVKRAGGWQRWRALHVLGIAQAVLVAAYRTVAGGEELHDAIAEVPYMRDATADAVSAVIESLFDAVKAAWPDAGAEAALLAELVAQFVTDHVEAMPEGLS